MTKLFPYLTFPGNCEEAFDYYRSVFGGEFEYKGRFSEMPDDPKYPVPEEDKSKIMHISLPLGDNYRLMGSDSGSGWGANTVIGNNISLSVNPSSKEKADEYFEKLSAGGQQTMPMSQTFWGDYFGMCKDKFGINWMISFNDGKQDG